MQNEVRPGGVYHNLLDSAGVARVFSGHARLLDPHQIEVAGERIRAETILIATGGYPTRPDLPGAELGLVSDDIFLLERQPKRIAVYGAGYVAVEFAAIFAGLGSETHLIYRREAPLKDFDQDIRAHFVEALASVPTCGYTRNQPLARLSVITAQRRTVGRYRSPSTARRTRPSRR